MSRRLNIVGFKFVSILGESWSDRNELTKKDWPLQFRQAIHGIWVLNTFEMTRNMPYYGLVFNRFVVFVSKHSKAYENLKVSQVSTKNKNKINHINDKFVSLHFGGIWPTVCH